VSDGGATWDTAGELTLDADNHFAFADVTEAGSDSPYNHAWWTYTPTASGFLNLDTFRTEATDLAAADTQIEIFTGTTDGDKVDVDGGFNDDAPSGEQPPGAMYLSKLSAPLQGGTTYHILVGTYGVDGGGVTSYGLNASFTASSGPPIYSMGGIIIPAGGPTIGSATPITLASISAPFAGSAIDDGVDTNPHGWFKLVAPEPGGVVYLMNIYSYSALFPYTAYNADLAVYSGPPGATTIGDLTPESMTGDTAMFVAGETYFIRISHDTDVTPEPFLLVLQVNDYPYVGDWIQDGDTSWVVGISTLHHDLDTVPLIGGVVGAGSYAEQFLGSYQIRSALGGPEPDNNGGTGDAARELSWHNAHLGKFDYQYLNSPATDAGYHGGFEEILKDGSYAPSGSSFSSDRFIGVIYGRSPGSVGQPATLTYTALADSIKYNITEVLSNFNQFAGLAYPTDFPPGFTGDLVWEDDATQPTLLGIDVSPDDTSAGDVGTGGHDGLGIVTWFMKAVPAHDGDEETWGPNAFAAGGTAATWTGGVSDPGEFPAAQDLQLDDYDGGLVEWTEVDPTIVTAAMEYEAADDLPDGFLGGLRFVGLFPNLISGFIPFKVPAGVPALGEDNIRLGRNYQWMAMRVRLRPARRRWVGTPAPVAPDLATLDITGDLDPVRRRFFG